ncbi:hypothetical protein P3F83_07765 [Mycobacteroides immunogenum]|uniref:hypothetical protein n=1 Tax=Mycobacteroides immunogenum TaxID=83262 RepID=UPI0025B793A1|nr:hypothetical protein [Mycobacteroides immunogenum]WJR35257.1 hypothetical protein P3F83_07765 [Mycobacteroides immunogenum]
MTAPEFELDDAAVSSAAASLEAMADQLAAAARAAQEAAGEIPSEASSYESEWEPDGLHAAKAKEVTALLTAQAATATTTAAALREQAVEVRNLRDRNAAVQEEAAADAEAIATEGISPDEGTTEV